MTIAQYQDALIRSSYLLPIPTYDFYSINFKNNTAFPSSSIYFQTSRCIYTSVNINPLMLSDAFVGDVISKTF